MDNITGRELLIRTFKHEKDLSQGSLDTLCRHSCREAEGIHCNRSTNRC